MGAHHLVNHNGRVTQEKVEAIKASDLLLLMDVVRDATGLYNVLERMGHSSQEFDELGTALRALGLMEVTPDGGA
jgi:hypothetical protein